MLTADSLACKNFIQTQMKDPAFFDELYCCLVRFMHRRWKKYAEHPGITLMDFGSVLRWTTEFLHEIMRTQYLNSAELRAATNFYM
jgi:hypothetical protein